MDNQALEKAVIKIYEQIAENGIINDNQLIFLLMYNKNFKNKNKKSDVDKLFDFGNKAINFLNKNFPKE